MKKILKKSWSKIYYAVLMFGVLAPMRTVFGADISGSVSNGVGISTGNNPTMGVKLDNPIRVDSIEALIAEILKIVVAIGTPIAVIFLMYSGFKFVTAQGSDTKLKEAKEMLLWTIVGIVVLLGASLISTVISGTINQLKVGL